MRWFWESAVQPLLQAVEARTIVEVGVAEGHTTAKLVAYAERHDGVVHGIDPTPRQGAIELDERSDRLVLHVEQSLTALPQIEDVDAVLIDGDHNWYTVINELRLLAGLGEERGREFPLTLLHDVDWPYGRRDHYYDPTTIPEEHRQPLAEGGLWPRREELLEVGGIGMGDHATATEGGPRNGVRTAVEDFLSESGEGLEFRSLIGFYGLGILFSQARLESKAGLRACLKTFESPGWLTAHCRLLEEHRLLMQARSATLRHRYEALLRTQTELTERSESP
jgi:hypothetical protein